MLNPVGTLKHVSYLNLHSVAHVDSHGVGAFHGRVVPGARLLLLLWRLDVALGRREVGEARNCTDEKEREEKKDGRDKRTERKTGDAIRTSEPHALP